MHLTHSILASKSKQEDIKSFAQMWDNMYLMQSNLFCELSAAGTCMHAFSWWVVVVVVFVLSVCFCGVFVCLFEVTR